MLESKSMASLIRRPSLFSFSSAPFLLLSSLPVTIDFPPPTICRTKMVDLETQIRSKEKEDKVAENSEISKVYGKP